MSSQNKVLATAVVIDDQPAVTEMVAEALQNPELEILTSNDPRQGLALVLQRRPRIVVLDLQMPGMSGMEVLEQIAAADPSIEVFLLTGNYSTSAAVAAVKAGASDYLTKPDSLGDLQQRVNAVLEKIRAQHEALTLDDALLESVEKCGIVGRSPKMLETLALIKRIAPYFRTVLVTGDTGTGKELAARTLHMLSPAAKGPFVPVNCAGIVDSLAESQLFGYVRGAFTGAVQDSVGWFEHANHGTLFLDEIGELPLSIQGKLLRILQTQQVQRVGSPVERKIDVRVIGATNRHLRQMVGSGHFREDLYYRLSMVELHLPRLTERREDLPLLWSHFLNHFSSTYGKPVKGFSPRAKTTLERYSWPGNIRELENAIGNACMMAEGDIIDVVDLPMSLRQPALRPENSDSLPSETEIVTLEELERRYVSRVLEAVQGNKNKAAELLAISRTTLYNILAKKKKTAATASS